MVTNCWSRGVICNKVQLVHIQHTKGTVYFMFIKSSKYTFIFYNVVEPKMLSFTYFVSERE